MGPAEEGPDQRLSRLEDDSVSLSSKSASGNNKGRGWLGELKAGGRLRVALLKVGAQGRGDKKGRDWLGELKAAGRCGM